jgi:hypothetical protein
MNNLNNGCPTIVTIALPTKDVGHALVVIGYDPATQELIFYNPATGKKQTESEVVRDYNYGRGFTNFNDLWAASNNLIKGNSMVTLDKVSPTPIISPGGGGGGANFHPLLT